MKSFVYKLTLLATILFCSRSSNAQIISTYAGTYGSISYSGDGGAATAAAVGNPNGVAVDKTGTVYFTDGTNNVVRKVTTAGVISTVAGNGHSGYSGDGGAATAAKLNFPQGLCIDTSGNIYIADELNHVVRKVSTSGIITTVVGTGSTGHSGDGGPATAATLPSADDVAIDKYGNMYIADGNYSVRKVTPAGIISTFAGVNYGYTGDGGMADTCTLSGPVSVDVDTLGNVYISDNQNMVIRRVDPSGIINTYAGNGVGAGSGFGGSYSGDGGPATLAGLDQPFGISVTKAGDLYIADQNNSLIRFVSASTGIITRTAGNLTLAYTGDGGMADTSGLNFAIDVAVDYSGNVYIADIDNDVVRKIKAPYSITIHTLHDTVCSGTSVSYTSTVIAPVSGYHYHWLANGSGVGGDSATYVADSVHTGDIIKCILTGGTGDTVATSNIITMTVIPTLSSSITISATPSGSICSGTTVLFTATAVNPGTSPVYHWTVNSGAVGTSASTYSYNPANGDTVVCKLNSSYRCISTPVVISAPIIMSVTPTVTPAVTIATATDTVCSSTSCIFTATPVNGGTTPHYQWFDHGTSIGSDTSAISYTPSSGSVISCRITSNATCRTRDTSRSNYITMVITTPLTPSITIHTVGGDTSCTGVADTFVAVTLHGGTTPVFGWFVNGIYASAGNPFVHTPSGSTEIIQCTLTASGCVTTSSVNSNVITLSVFSYTTPTVSITASHDTVCAGTSVTFTPTATSTGTSPIYRWNKNGSYVATGTTYSDTPSSSDVYYCTLVSNAHCNTTDTVSSASMSIVVNPILTPSVTISASPSDTVCSGVAVTYTATAVSGGTAPTYTWYKNRVSVGTSSSYTYAPANGDTITCRLTSSAPCTTSATAMSSPIVMVVNPTVVPSVTVVDTPGDTVCAGIPVSFTATAVNGGSSPAYQWQKGGVNIAGATSLTYSYTPASGDVITFRLISSNICAIPDTAYSAAHNILVNAVVVPSVTDSSNYGTSVCVGTSVTFTATGYNGGSAPTYQWRVNSVNVGTSSSYTYVPTSGDIVICKYTSNAPCRTADSVFTTAITMTVVTSGTPSATVAAVGGDTVCVGSPVTIRPTAVLGGASPTFRWFINGADSGLAPTYTYVPSAGDVIHCIMHSSSSCAVPDSAISDSITISISSSVVPSVSISTPLTTVCSGNPATFTPTSVNGGYSPIYDWFVNGIFAGTGSTYTFTPFAGDMVRCTLHSNRPCASPDTAVSNTITMAINATVVPSVTVAATPGTSVSYGTPVTFTATPVNGGSSPTYVWLLNGNAVAGVSGATYLTDTLYNGDVVRCVLLSNATCANPPFDTSAITTIMITNVGVVNVNKGAGAIELHPNPNTGSFILTGSAIGTADNNAQVIITDMLGKIVYQGTVAVVNGKLNSKIALGNDLMNGLYLLNVKYTEGSTVLHFVLQQ